MQILKIQNFQNKTHPNVSAFFCFLKFITFFSYQGLKQTTRFGISNWVLKIWHFFMTWMLVGGIYFGLRHLVTQTIRSRVNYPMVTSLANLEQDHLLELNKPEKWNTWNLNTFFLFPQNRFNVYLEIHPANFINWNHMGWNKEIQIMLFELP